jgi:hypothetical protein
MLNFLKFAKRSKKTKSSKQPYVWGNLGQSEVSAAIARDHHGSIPNRKERKQAAKIAEKPFRAYYNH